MDRRQAVGLGHQRHLAATFEIGDRALAAARHPFPRRAGGTRRAGATALRPGARRGSRAGSSRRWRTSAAISNSAPSWSSSASASARISACISFQSPTAARTSASTRCSHCTSSCRARESARSTSRYMIDSRFLSGQIGSMPVTTPLASRSTQTTGCSSRWMIRPRPEMALATESTRNGMSSLTMQIRIIRARTLPPIDSSRTSAIPGGRRCAVAATNRAASRQSPSSNPSISPAGRLRSGLWR